MQPRFGGFALLRGRWITIYYILERFWCPRYQVACLLLRGTHDRPPIQSHSRLESRQGSRRGCHQATSLESGGNAPCPAAVQARRRGQIGEAYG